MKAAIGCTVIFVTHSVFESVFLSDRIVVMAARPGRVIHELEVDTPYPSDTREFRTSAEYAAHTPRPPRGEAIGEARMSKFVRGRSSNDHRQDRRARDEMSRSSDDRCRRTRDAEEAPAGARINRIAKWTLPALSWSSVASCVAPLCDDERDPALHPARPRSGRASIVEDWGTALARNADNHAADQCSP